MTLQTRRLTYEEYLSLPETKVRYEIVDGVMVMCPSPTIEHQRILRKIFLALHQFAEESGFGEVFFAPLDILVQREPLRTRQPDLLFVRTERTSILGQIVEGGPDLVVEVLSPGNSRADVEGKLADYLSMRVSESWLVSPEARTVEVLVLNEGNWRRKSLYGLGDTVESTVLTGLSLSVSELFV